MRKKIILLGSILAIGAPAIITIACSQKKNYDNVNFIKTPKNDIKNIYLNKYYRPLCLTLYFYKINNYPLFKGFF